MLYAGEFDDFICPQSVGVGADNVAWDAAYNAATNDWDVSRGLIQPYMHNTAIQDCPVGRSLPVAPGIPGLVSYGINANVAGISSTAVEYPSETIILGDAAGYTNTDASYNFVSPVTKVDTLWPTAATYAGPTTHGVHSGFSCIAWCDGHAKAMKVVPLGFDIVTPYGFNGPTEQMMEAEQMGDVYKYPREVTSAMMSDFFNGVDNPAYTHAAACDGWYYYPTHGDVTCP